MLTPEDSLRVLGADNEEVEIFRQFHIFSVRHLANIGSGRSSLGLNKDRLELLINRAQAVILNRPFTIDEAEETEDPKNVDNDVDDYEDIWGYVNTSHETSSKILSEQEGYKSAYVLFHEYMECTPEQRLTHPWKQIYFMFKDEVQKWNPSLITASDTDVFSYLIWQHAPSVGQVDVTIGARGIPFYWLYMPKSVQLHRVNIDRTIARELNCPMLQDRNSCTFGINLTKLCKEFGGVLYKTDGGNEKWIPITLAQTWMQSGPNTIQEWETLMDPMNIFANIPHGCIVLPNGEIPASCMKLAQQTISTSTRTTSTNTINNNNSEDSQASGDNIYDDVQSFSQWRSHWEADHAMLSMRYTLALVVGIVFAAIFIYQSVGLPSQFRWS